MKTIRGCVLLLLLVVLTGCGGGGGGGGSTGETPLSAGDHYLLFTVYSTATLPVPVSSVELGIKLPAGVTVATTGGAAKDVPTASLTGYGSFASQYISGTYSSASAGSGGGIVHVGMVAAPSDFRIGRLLKLKFTVLLGQTVYASSFMVLNPGSVYHQMLGAGVDTQYLNDEVGVAFQVTEYGGE